MPSLSSLRSHLAHFLTVTSASEVVLFERTTFLVISSVTSPTSSTPSSTWDERRFERVSTMVKAFKLGCSKIRAPFTSLVVQTSTYAAVLDSLTPETYILVVGQSGIRESPDLLSFP
jgi:Ras-related GTP-binding protein A/B